MQNLIVYKASAGSGKTHKLTGEYLMLAFKGDYRNILAVTFTNKATAEMKSRIVDELHRLAAGKKSDYLEMLSQQLHKDEKSIRIRAKEILDAILRNYSRFSVGTIDSFFQRIIRGFAREAGLQSVFDLELDNRRVLERALDLIMVDSSSDEELYKWLMEYAESRIRDGKSWNFRQDMMRLGQQVFSESYMQFRGELTRKLSDRSFLNSYKQKLYAVVNRYELAMKEAGRKGLDMIRQKGLEVDDFKYGSSGVAGYFEKISEKKRYEPGKRVSGASAPDDWAAKNSPARADIEALLGEGLQAALDEALVLYRDEHQLWLSAKHILSGFYTLGILNDIAVTVRNYSAENNMILLSEVVSLLSGIIAGNEAPFIYEKTGWFYRHYMIDEFQDTSRVQWQNFIPLIAESMSRGHRNILVGDVKQSIYRWRNSDWNILASGVEKMAGHHGVIAETLEHNWRSRRAVIEFNNSLFDILPGRMEMQLGQECAGAGFDNHEASALMEQLRNAYRGHNQSIPGTVERDGGFVRVSFFDNTGGDWRDEVLRELPSLLLEIKGRGFRLRDIAILVRNHRDGNDIASRLLGWQAEQNEDTAQKLSFISEEFLLLNESLSVRLLLALIRFMADPSDRLNKAVIINEFCRYLGARPDEYDTDHRLFGDPANYAGEGWDKLMPSDFAGSAGFLQRLSLYELVEQLIRCFGLDKKEREIPYLMAFQDAVADFSRREGGGPAAFARWWEENGARLAVSSNDNQDAVRIMTIHKSKGLQFGVVLVPFGDWLTDHNPMFDNFLWCRPDRKPFDELPLVPVKYRSDMAGTIFSPDYFKEKMQVYVDNLNLLYVAFTRAKEELFAYAPVPGKSRMEKGDVRSVADLLWSALGPGTPAGAGLDNGKVKWQWEGSSLMFKCGSPVFGKADEEVSSDGELVARKYPVHQVMDKPGLRIAGSPLPAAMYGSYDDPVERGRIIHEILSDIILAEDIENAVMKRCFEGRISSVQAQRLTDDIRKMIRQSGTGTWFDGSMRVLTEISVLLPGGKVRRPDRVMFSGDEVVVVDYKSGMREPETHDRQMRGYIRDIEDMGCPVVKGYLWYTGTGQLVEVKE